MLTPNNSIWQWLFQSPNNCLFCLFLVDSLFKKPPMKFKVWESKLCDRLNSWYKAIEKDGQVFVSIHINMEFLSAVQHSFS